MNRRLLVTLTAAVVLLALFSRAIFIRSLPMEADFIRALPIDGHEHILKRLPKLGDEPYYFQIARAILHKGEFTEGYLKAYRPPGYPAFLALHLALFGERTLPIQVSQNLIFLAAVAVLALIAWREGGAPMALTSTLLALTTPQWLIRPQTAYSETLHVLPLVLAFWLVLRLHDAAPRSRWRFALLAGILFGLSALVREIGMYLGFMAAILLWLHLRRRDPRRNAGVWPAAAIVAGVLLAVLPWTARNYAIFGHFVPITTNTTINMYQGNNPQGVDHRWLIPPDVQPLWNTTSPRGANEYLVYRRSGTASVEHIRNDPLGFFARWPAKMRDLWGPVPHEPKEKSVTPRQSAHGRADHAFRVLRWAHWPPFAALTLWGLWIMRRQLAGTLLIGTILLASLVHGLTVGAPGYRAPYELLFALPAAAALLHLLALARARLVTRNSQLATSST